ncbi:MAG: DUF4367 domain-containing protein [Lachnospiraceae bacterium]|nr:DUF4367 domain-containing protein [Lachnospiraceae bacterium]
MKEQYRELLDDVHLSEKAVKEIEKKGEQLRRERKRVYGGSKVFKAAACFLVILVLGSSAAGAAVHYSRMNSKDDSRVNGRVENDIADIVINTTEPKAKEDTTKDNGKSAFYDVKLSYVPEGYRQDKEDLFLYRHTKENKFFSVILYHLKTKYQTVRAAEKLKKFKSSLGQGYYGGKEKGEGKSYFAILVFKDSNYMVYIDGSNMPLKEVKKIAQGSSLVEVAKKKDIQASFIEWTKERQEEVNNFRKIQFQYSH